MRFTIVMLMLTFASVVCAQQPARVAIVEVKHTAPGASAPRECLATFRQFFQYLQKSEPGIVRDEQAQKRWLTQQLRKALTEKLATFSSPADDPDYPSNNTFIGSWDQPTSYSVVASRRYGKRAVIDVLYKWGPQTNYPGDERTTSFIFMLEDGSWKLDDIYTFRGEFVQAESLNQYFREKK